MSGPAERPAISTAPLSAATRTRIEALRDRYPSARSAILPCLWAVQEELGWLSPGGLAEVAGILDLAPSEVAAVSSFYSMYFKRPEGRHHLLVCVNAPCALRGADDTVRYLEEKLGCASGSTTADGMYTWQATIECLGACGYAPMMQIDHHFHEFLTPDRIDAILESVAAGPAAHAAPSSGNGHGRVAADPGDGPAATDRPGPGASAGPGRSPRRRPGPPTK